MLCHCLCATQGIRQTLVKTAACVCVLEEQKGNNEKTYTFEGFFRYLGNTGSV